MNVAFTFPDRQEWVELPNLSARYGHRIVIEVHEPSVGSFAIDIPDTPPSTKFDCYEKVDDKQSLHVQWESWVDSLLARVVQSPTWLRDPIKIRRLGADREHISKIVLAKWGINQKLVYKKNFLRMVRKMSKTLRIRPLDILRWPTSEFWTDWYILFSPELIDDSSVPDTLRGITPPLPSEFEDA